ncbi:Crp/Fnr family transcriptional regulator [Paenibacillus rhizovicinus]|uniref:Crp/Fnr family transcriptional regulator n=1 Tax=Paenibacillus rhizovicinus TaxID=2704463 RepID=A0A6C0NZB2_9BACL|nr:Crp/Fnr family transcriptional regulator [Paenibacillus rhizovicinus]QHW31276.1 Crp/Fnr family transcriptional regulator [Paenibacillus rhizovicinus]
MGERGDQQDFQETGDFQDTDDVKETVANLFREHGTVRTYRKHEFVFQENDPPSAAHYVETGLIKISQSSQEGQGITLFLRYPGEMFGNAELLTRILRRRYAQCLTESQVITLDARLFQELARSNSAFSYALAVITARRLLQTQNMVETLISRPVAWRLAWFLMQMGREQNDQIEVQLQLSHEEISYVIGCSRQTVTEILNKWREKALITYTKKQIVIHHPSRFFSVL